jgi:hypothetical protein
MNWLLDKSGEVLLACANGKILIPLEYFEEYQGCSQMHNISENGRRAWDALYDTTP